MDINITKPAQNKIIEYLSNAKANYIRLAIRGGGCSGFSYEVLIEDSPQGTDWELKFNEFTLVVDPISYQYLKGMTLDWKQDPNNLAVAGFSFENPNASGSCGCGSSFSV